MSNSRGRVENEHERIASTDPSTVEALRQVAAKGWEEEARLFAEAALAALSDRQPDKQNLDKPTHGGGAGGGETVEEHIMLSYQVCTRMARVCRASLPYS